MILKFFKSPTCGPCKMFTPQIKSAIAETNVTEEDYELMQILAKYFFDKNSDMAEVYSKAKKISE